MALNYSHRPILAAHRPEDNVNVVQGGGFYPASRPEDNVVQGGGFYPAHWPEDNVNVVQGGTQERDIRDILPADPFGMDYSSTVTAITGWLEDLRVGYGGYGGTHAGVGTGHYPLFAGWNFLWDTSAAMPLCGRSERDYATFRSSGFGGCGYGLDEKPRCRVGNCGGVNFGCCTMEDLVCGLGNSIAHMDGVYGIENEQEVVGKAADEVDDDDDDEGPHPALSYALAYLGVRDLMSVERVCKTWRSTVQNDPLLWKRIHLERPMSDRITDDVLIQLTSRAQGHLQSLNLWECQRITDDGLRHVLENNPRLTKLSVPGCTRLSIDSVISFLRAFQVGAVSGIKHLRVSGLTDLTPKHFEELSSLLGVHSHVQADHHKPRILLRGNCYKSCDDDRPLDIELCPTCQNVRVVFDCPAESCLPKGSADQLCRACLSCIARCVYCGRCITHYVYNETFLLENLCQRCDDRSRPDVRGDLVEHDVEGIFPEQYFGGGSLEHDVFQQQSAASLHGQG